MTGPSEKPINLLAVVAAAATGVQVGSAIVASSRMDLLTGDAANGCLHLAGSDLGSGHLT
jgi:hypothetical protein